MRSVSPGLVAYRYQELERAVTPTSPLKAVVGQLQFLTSNEYVHDLLVNTHSISSRSAKARVPAIIAHARTGLAYVEQALAGPSEVSFLPGYYAILNFMKIYVLVSSRHDELVKNRYHGMFYKAHLKDSRSLLTEKISVGTNGTLKLFYEIVSGKQWGRQKAIVMRDVYPYIADVASEWYLASQTHSLLAGIGAKANSDTGRELIVDVALPVGMAKLDKRAVPSLRGVAQDLQDSKLFRRTIPDLSETPIQMLRKAIDPVGIYFPYSEDRTTVALYRKSTVIFEEWPIALAYFHMSSVVRYNPEFLAALRDSRYWPVVAALQDSLYRFLVLTWSHARRKTVIFTTY